MYVQQERFPWYYGKGITRKNFFDNSVASADPSKRVRSFEPSVAKRTLISSIDFGADGRDEETRVFQGLITPGVCTDGVYIFRVTSDDASHLLLNGAVAIDNGGEHGPVTKTHARKLSDGEPVEFQVRHLTHRLPAPAVSPAAAATSTLLVPCLPWKSISLTLVCRRA